MEIGDEAGDDDGGTAEVVGTAGVLITLPTLTGGAAVVAVTVALGSAGGVGGDPADSRDAAKAPPAIATTAPATMSPRRAGGRESTGGADGARERDGATDGAWTVGSSVAVRSWPS